jgi:hypothetical protein
LRLLVILASQLLVLLLYLNNGTQRLAQLYQHQQREFD